jgi:hypothetical protein
MKKKYSCLVMIIGICVAYSACQEFIKPKKKKQTVSVQQDVELDGDLIKVCTQASGVLIDLAKAVFSVTNAAVNRVDDYACGDNESCSKTERAERYTKKMKIKEKMDDCIEQLERMLQSLNALITSLDE